MNDIVTRKEHKAMSAGHVIQADILREPHRGQVALTERIKGRQGG